MASDRDDERTPTAYEIIFSCSVCQATISDIYRDEPQVSSTNAARNGNGNTENISTKLWLTECAHLTCGKHLDGGGVPFHTDSEQPKAPCPRCVADKGDNSKKCLFGVRGFREGFHDKAIPQAWFDTPPIKLDASSAGLEAIRFQYLALVQFGTQTLKRHRALQSSYAHLDQRATELDASRRTLQNALKASKDKEKQILEIRRENEDWKRRAPQIKHYLGIMTKLADENKHMKSELTALGYETPESNYSYPEHREDNQHMLSLNRQVPAGHGVSPNSAIDVEQYEPRRPLTMHHDSRLDHSRSSKTLSGDVQHEEPHAQHTLNVRTSSSKKRDFQQYQSDVENSGTDPKPSLAARVSSRGLMPPPRAPSARPPFHLDSQQTTAPAEPTKLELYNNGVWKSLKSGKQGASPTHDCRNVPSPLPNPDKYVMSGALRPPTERADPTYDRSPTHPRHDAQQSYPKATSAAHNATSKAEQPAKLPFLKPLHPPVNSREPQHIRSERERYYEQTKHDIETSRHRPVEQGYWRPDESAPNSVRYPYWISGNGQISDDDRRQFGSDAIDRQAPHTVQRFSNACYRQEPDLYTDPRTPSMTRIENGSRTSRSVASPFFRRSDERPRSCLPTNEYAMRPTHQVEASFPNSSRGNMNLPSITEAWMEPRNLNGLSFISSPRNSRNEPFIPNEIYVPHDIYAIRNEQGLFQRPEATLQRAYYPSFRKPGSAAPLPSTMPSTINKIVPSSRSNSRYLKGDVDVRNVIRGAKASGISSRSPYRQRLSRGPGQESRDTSIFAGGGMRRRVMR